MLIRPERDWIRQKLSPCLHSGQDKSSIDSAFMNPSYAPSESGGTVDEYVVSENELRYPGYAFEGSPIRFGIHKMNSKIPSYDQLMNPLLKALGELGGSGSTDEMYERVSHILGLPDEILGILHSPEKSSKTEIEYRLAWARTYLKNFGILEKSSRGVWAIVSDKRHVLEIDPAEVVRTVRILTGKKKVLPPQVESSTEKSIAEPPSEPLSWKEQLHLILSNELDPSAFERLIQRLLRESGFIQVEVTGRTGDGGIDGKGIARIHGFLSFHVVFQCKRYKGSVSAPEIRAFRGAMAGRADKGLFVTTGLFTRDAIKEASRDGASFIDLVDGDQLALKLKDLALGIKTHLVEKVVVDQDWFNAI